MPLTQDEQLVNNSKAHLQSIQGELGVATATLGDTLTKVDAAKKELTDIQERIGEENFNLKNIEDNQVRLILEHNEKTADLAKRESAFVAEQQAFEDYKSRELSTIANAKIKLEEEIAGKTNDIKKLDDELWETADMVKDANKYLANIKDECTAILEQIKASRKELQNLDDAREAGAADKALMEKTLLGIKAEIEAAQKTLRSIIEDFKKPEQSFNEQKRLLAIRERDVEIIRQRIFQDYKELYPNRVINI